ncbi:unnamed protein product, partial [Citrullus colocynthis]
EIHRLPTQEPLDVATIVGEICNQGQGVFFPTARYLRRYAQTAVILLVVHSHRNGDFL